MGTMILPHLNIKELDSTERVSAIKEAVFESMSDLEHGAHRRVELDLDDLWVLLADVNTLRSDNKKLVDKYILQNTNEKIKGFAISILEEAQEIANNIDLLDDDEEICEQLDEITSIIDKAKTGIRNID